MKLSELRPCVICNGKLVPMWYVIRISQAMLNPKAANGVLGLTQMFGGSAQALAIAEVMAPDDNCVTIIGDNVPELMTQVNICQECFLHKVIDLPSLMETINHVKREKPEVNTSTDNLRTNQYELYEEDAMRAPAHLDNQGDEITVGDAIRLAEESEDATMSSDD